MSAHGVAYSEIGLGPTVVLLHGVGLCGDVWLPQQQALAAHYRVVSPDLPGHGGSAALGEAQSEAPTLDHYCDRLESALLDIEPSGPVILIGHSLGALLSERLAVRGRLTVAGLCLVSGVYNRDMGAMRSVIRRAEQVRQHSVQDLATAPLERWFGESPDPVGRACAYQCRVWLEHAAKRGYAPAYRVFAEQTGPSVESLRSLNVPALFLTGERDPNSTPSMSQAMAVATEKGVACTVSEAAHMLTMTHSYQVNLVLSEFCAGC